MEDLNTLRVCAILHDIGKPECWFKGKAWPEHVRYTGEIVGDAFGEKYAVTAMRHHTGPPYDPEDYPKTDLEKIICIANNIASGADWGARDEYVATPKPPLLLTHVLSDGSVVRARSSNGGLLAKIRQELIKIGKETGARAALAYPKIYQFLRKELKSIPADTRAPANDVSLWHHLKLTTAIATCIWMDGGYKGGEVEKYSFSLLSGDADRVTRFVNISRRLPDLRAGSKMVEKATRAAGEVVISKLGPECLIFAGGGGILALAPPKEAESILSLAKEEFEKASGGELTITVNSISADGSKVRSSFGDLWRKAMSAIRMKKACSPSAPSWRIEEGVQPCDSCGAHPGVHPTDIILPYDASPRHEMLCETCYRRRTSEEAKGVWLEDLVDSCGFLGMIKADGDSLGEVLSGKRIKKFGKAMTPSRLSTISEMIDECYGVGLRDIVKGEGGECIYAGGEDLLAVLPGNKALGCAHKLALNFTREMGGQATLSAGVVIFKERFPCYVALGLASQLIENAKNQQGKASIDFEILSAVEMTPTDVNLVKRTKQKELRHSNKPYRWAEFAELLSFAESLGDGTISPSQLNTIARIIRTEGVEAAQDHVKYQMGRCQIPWRRGETLIDQIGAGSFLDAFTIYNAFHKREVIP